MKTLFQSIGIVFSIVLLIVTTLALLYISYILGIAFVVLAMLYVVYNSLKWVENPK